MKKTFAVIGLGRFGEAVARQLAAQGKEVLVMDQSEEPVQKLSDIVTHAVVADAKDISVLKSLGIGEFDSVIVAIGSDVASSIIITVQLKELGVREIVCKAGSDIHKQALLKVGADKVIIPEKEMGIKVAQNLASQNVMDFIELSEDYSIMELLAPEPWQFKNLRELNIRARYDVSVIAMRRGTKILVSPGADEIVQPGDILVALGGVEALSAISDL